MRRLFALALITTVAACAGEPISAPPPSTPLAGTYQVNAAFQGVPTDMASTSGTITFARTSATDTTLVASANLVVNVNGATMTLTEISDLQLAANGVLSFKVETLNPTATWSWTGLRASETKIAGKNTLASPGVESSPGSFTMVRVDSL
jgi:hypothetical protein